MGGNRDQLVRLANGVRLVDNDRCRHCNFLFADNTPRRQPWRLARRGAFGHEFVPLVASQERAAAAATIPDFRTPCFKRSGVRNALSHGVQ